MQKKERTSEGNTKMKRKRKVYSFDSIFLADKGDEKAQASGQGVPS